MTRECYLSDSSSLSLCFRCASAVKPGGGSTMTATAKQDQSPRRATGGEAATRPVLVWSFDRFRRVDRNSRHGGDQGFRGISSLAALSPVFHGPWSPSLPLALGPLSRKRSEEKLIGRGLRIMSNVIVYSKPSCVQCTATYRALDTKGVRYEVIDLTTQPADVVESFKARGLMQAPIVVTDTDEWAGFQPDRIAALAA